MKLRYIENRNEGYLLKFKHVSKSLYYYINVSNWNVNPFLNVSKVISCPPDLFIAQ